MKANELMVGDWVQFTSKQWLAEEDACPLKVTCVGEPKYPDFYPYIRIEGRNENYHIDLFQPIPLTTEILEKNGFKYNPFSTGFYECKTEDGNIACTKTDYWSFYINDNIIPNHFHYVHELQHVLKLCGITLNIEV